MDRIRLRRMSQGIFYAVCCCTAIVHRPKAGKLSVALRVVGGSSETANDTSTKKKAAVGCLIVGLGGNNGVTVVAGLLANRQGLSWEGAKKQCVADWTGCVTQRELARKTYNLASFDDAAVAGWDIRGTPLGNALVEARVLDFDLASQVRDEMNTMRAWPGVWDRHYIGETQHDTATNVVDESLTLADKIERIRRDIRQFKERVSGHTTVVWSASVEANSELDPAEVATADKLMATLTRNTTAKAPPSLLYAVAAALENCSFVNGGSQDTICPGLEELFRISGGYCLGTDFKAGQTKAKSCVVEYLEALALRVKVVASSNHLGNNDMKNLLGRQQRKAKLRVKSDVFPPDSTIESHTVSVSYTPFIGDEKRDVVEYTSEAFLSQLHTMVTYTRCSDSVLCAPLIIDACVWCDAFKRRGVPLVDAQRALAYLFKVPTNCCGNNKNYFFFSQLGDLDRVCEKYLLAKCTADRSAPSLNGAPPQHAANKMVACVGIACLDVELVRAAKPTSLERITPFKGTTQKAGGSSPQTATALSRLGQRCIVVANIGDDMPGTRLQNILREEGVEYLRASATPPLSTGMAVVPVFEAGGRGCFFDPGDNDKFGPKDVADALDALGADVGALHVGYPHLMPSLCGRDLEVALSRAKASHGPDLVISLDLNGVQALHRLGDDVLDKNITCIVDMLHANAEEATTLLGNPPIASLEELAVELSRQSEAALVVVTDGANGAVLVAADSTRLAHSALPNSWASTVVRVAAYSAGTERVNANGAGDAFCAGLLAAILHSKWQDPLSLQTTGQLASLTAYLRVIEAEPTPMLDLIAALRPDIPGAKAAAHFSLPRLVVAESK